MLYPLKMRPVFKEKVWGGKKLKEKYGKKATAEKTGESWEVACHENGMSLVDNGYLKGKSLAEVIGLFGKDVLGYRIVEKFNRFPILIKIIDVEQKVSIQVHPDDKYALENENSEYGKTEMWYILDADWEAKVVYGVNSNVTRDIVREKVKNGSLEEILNFVDVYSGDAMYLPAKTIHGLMEGITLVEIQQNSDLTYRLYDWNRASEDGRRRELHIDKSLAISNLTNARGCGKIEGFTIMDNDNKRTYLVACKYFAVEKIEVNSSIIEMMDRSKFHIIIVVNGLGKISYNGSEEIIKPGESFLIPAAMGDYVIKEHCTVLKIYVPDIQKDIIEPLCILGVNRQDLIKITGLENFLDKKDMGRIKI